MEAAGQESVGVAPSVSAGMMIGVRRRHAVASVSTIAEVAAVAGVTLRALRYYEEVGLLTPTRLAGGVRRFDPHQRDKAIMVASLRRMDLSIAHIRWVLDVETTDEGRRRFLDGLLNDQLARLRSKYNEIQAAMDRLAAGDPQALSAI